MNIEKSNVIREFIGIEYPGRVENVDKMIETLGGAHEISRTFEEKQKLQLKLNPKNLYCKSAISTEQEPATGMLLKLRIKRLKDHPEKKIEYLSAELVGTVKAMYKFNNFSDYEYLPIQKNEKTGETENIYHEIVPEDPQAGPQWFREETDVPIFLPPVAFCRSDVTQSSMLRNEQKLFSDAENDEIAKFAVTNRSSRLKNGIMVQYTNDLEVPVPSKSRDGVDFKKSNVMTEDEYNLLVKLFNERPIWTLSSLRAHIREFPKRLSNVLAFIAFFYTTGPWRNCFVRFGYDPRKDFASRYYQMLDYRVRQGAGFKVDAHSKRPSAINKRIKVIPKDMPNTSSLTQENIDENFLMRQKEAIFTEETIPPFRARQYQFVDIHLPKVQEMLEKIPGPISGAVCNEKRGWLPIQFMEDVREILTNIAQSNMMKMCKEKDMPFEEATLESIGESMEQNEDIFEESSDDEESAQEPMDMDIDLSL